AMLRVGMNVARLNFSHGTHEEHEKTIALFRRVRDRLKMPAAVLLDTKGPEIRLGTFAKEGGVDLTVGQTFTLTTEQVEGDETRASVTYRDLPRELKAGNRVLINDGAVVLVVESTAETEVVCRVEIAGHLSNRKGINLPYVKLNMPFLSRRDEEDLLFGIAHDVDFVAASFVRSARDVIDMRRFLNYHGGHKIRIIAKIENNEGVENFEEILEQADGLMVARGDMGVEIEFERLPGIQKRLIRACYQSGKMVITATQMLESMIHANTPTRAEISDVANAVFDGTSAVMLSGETAMGDHPARVVEVMSKIVEQAEADALAQNAFGDMSYHKDKEDTTGAVCDAACTLSRDLNAKAIVAVTQSGLSARRVSKFRPKEAIVASTPDPKTFHQLSLSWGVIPVLALQQDTVDGLYRHAIDCAKNADVVVRGDKVVITAGAPLGQSGSTNILKVETVD
ncbi:MAG: pyruvate kinase, partial [Clostridia bacterium]|nr:pyruvate kinase [Clostridia bacterium]